MTLRPKGLCDTYLFYDASGAKPLVKEQIQVGLEPEDIEKLDKLAEFVGSNRATEARKGILKHMRKLEDEVPDDVIEEMLQ